MLVDKVEKWYFAPYMIRFINLVFLLLASGIRRFVNVSNHLERQLQPKKPYNIYTLQWKNEKDLSYIFINFNPDSNRSMGLYTTHFIQIQSD